MSGEQGSELQDLRHRLVKLRAHLDQQAVLVADARELLERESTWPRPRQQVEEELERAIRFDVPMLLTEIVRAERRIGELGQEPSTGIGQQPATATGEQTCL